jgi:hypothetical protein
MGPLSINILDFPRNSFITDFFSLSSFCALSSLCTLRFLLKQETGWASVSVGNAGVVVGLAISARNRLGLRFEVGNAGVVVVAWGCDLSVVVAWGCDLGVVVAWACRSCGSRPGFADLGVEFFF